MPEFWLEKVGSLKLGMRNCNAGILARKSGIFNNQECGTKCRNSGQLVEHLTNLGTFGRISEMAGDATSFFCFWKALIVC